LDPLNRDRVVFEHRLLAGLLEDLPDVVIVLDLQGRLRWGNHAAERLFGRSLHDSIGLPGLELVHPEDLAWNHRPDRSLSL
jgi:PAS domain S-box-containing protein